MVIITIGESPDLSFLPEGIELDRGCLLSYPGNFSTYKRLKAEQLAIEAVENAKFDKFLAEEEVWVRKGIEARRTRNEGRVRRLEALRLQTYRHQRGTHALAGRVVFGSLADRLMRCRSRLQQLIAGLYALRQHLQRQGTGDFATLVTAHTVGDGP